MKTGNKCIPIFFWNSFVTLYLIDMQCVTSFYDFPFYLG